MGHGPLAAFGVELITPYRPRRTHPTPQDRCPLRRHKRHWEIWRLYASLGNFRRLVVSYERRALTYLAFVQLGCILILRREGLLGDHLGVCNILDINQSHQLHGFV